MEFQKIQISKTGTLNATYKNADGDIIQFAGANIVHKDLKDAMAAIIPHLALITEQREAYKTTLTKLRDQRITDDTDNIYKRMTVDSLSFSNGEQRIFDVDMASTITETKGRIPVIDMRVSAGFGISLMEGNEQRVNEYVTMDGLNGCVGIYVYGDSMNPDYRAGDIVFVRQILNADEIDYGRPYVIVTRDDRVLKCIYQSKHDATCLRLISLNEDTNRHGDRLYPDREIKKENILFIYKVVGMFRREQL